MAVCVDTSSCTSADAAPAETEFYQKGWREQCELGDEEDFLQTVLKNTTNGRDLNETLQKLLESGGDERSVSLPETGLTKYHTPTKPCEGVHRSCCTSNVPNEEAWSRGLDTLRQLLLEAENISKQKNRNMLCTSPEDLFRKMLGDIRERLRSVFELSCDDFISLFPSGTDAELMPALLGFGRAHRGDTKRGREILTIVTAAGEVGSGTTLASTGKHFAKMLPSGRSPSQEDNRVFDGEFSCVDLCLRVSGGRLMSPAERDQKVEDEVAKAIESSGSDGLPRYGCVVVHMVLGSKTGLTMPSFACLDRLVQKYGSLVLPVIDACQGRFPQGVIRECLDKNYAVLSTGSKFFGGPPFSGVCLLSEQTGHELDLLLAKEDLVSMVDRSKLKEYVVAALLSDDLPNMRRLLPQRPLNYGVLMRWTFALHSMESYFVDVPREESFQLMSAWSSGVEGLLEEMKSPFLTVLKDADCEDAVEQQGDQGIALSTIVSFHCRCNRGIPGEPPAAMTMDELRHVQYLMASDLSKNYPHMSLLAPAKLRCFIGQPVDLTPGMKSTEGTSKENVLRVALSAPVMVRLWNEGIDKILAEDRSLFEKMNLILGNWSTFQPSSK